MVILKKNGYAIFKMKIFLIYYWMDLLLISLRIHWIWITMHFKFQQITIKFNEQFQTVFPPLLIFKLKLNNKTLKVLFIFFLILSIINPNHATLFLKYFAVNTSEQSLR